MRPLDAKSESWGWDPQATCAYIESLRDREGTYGGYSISEGNPPTLYASCAAAFARRLLGDLNRLTDGERLEWIERIKRTQDPNTGFFVTEASGVPSPVHNEAYFQMQLATFCLSALDALGGAPDHPFTAIRPLQEKTVLEIWLEGRDWSQPWVAGNEVMFLAILMIANAENHDHPEASEALGAWFDWHDARQDPKTGFWGDGPILRTLDGMGGAMHQFLIYFRQNRPLAHLEKIIDQTLKLQMPDGLFHPAWGGGGCEEYDAALVLARLSEITDYRKSDIQQCLSKMRTAILELRNAEGGFRWSDRSPVSLGMWARQISSLAKHRDPYYWYIINRRLAGRTMGKHGSGRSVKPWGENDVRWDSSDLYAVWMRCMALGHISEVLPTPESASEFGWLNAPGLGWNRKA